MRFFRTEVWGYAVLLIILFAIASIAVSQTLSYLQEQVAGGDFKVIAILIWTITLGFMLIAGAFGLWAIQFSAESESRRRIGLLIDAMDYLSDGLIAVNRQGRIGGSNPAAKTMAGATVDINDKPLTAVFPCLSSEDEEMLISTDEPTEFERNRPAENTVQILRFRSQPSEGVTLILISDVTTTNDQRLRARHAARLQLIGQIARGVAHDFNNLLFTISGHAALMGRVKNIPRELAESASAITRGAERGISLAGHLLGLSQPTLAGASTYMLPEHLRNATQMLRDSLPLGWEVDCNIEEDLPAVAMPGMQIEQAVLNLGFLVTETSAKPDVLRIVAARPRKASLLDVGKTFAVVIIVTASNTDSATSFGDTAQREQSRESGVILSVIRSMVEEVGGALAEPASRTTPYPIYRIALPHSTLPVSRKKNSPEVLTELKAYVANWSVLMAHPNRAYNPISSRLGEVGARIEHTDNIMSALARIEEGKDIDVMLLDRQLLGQEGKALLKAILRLRPSAGVIVLCEDPELESESGGLSSDIIFIDMESNVNTLLTAMIDSRSLAMKRKNSPAPNRSI